MSNSRRDQLIENLRQRFASFGADIECQRGEVLLILSREHLLEGCQILKEDEAFQYNQLIDVCGVDYATYGQSEWIGDAASARGFSRGTHPDASLRMSPDAVSRFAVVYHLLSTIHNHRLRLRVYLDSDQPTVPSLNPVWASANWFERETYDLFGIVFEGHPDLRRILTDYGFIGHPFRKDFPLSGHVEVRYDPDKKRVVYEPVSIEPRTLVPRVIRHDHRYIHEPESE